MAASSFDQSVFEKEQIDEDQAFSTRDGVVTRSTLETNSESNTVHLRVTSSTLEVEFRVKVQNIMDLMWQESALLSLILSKFCRGQPFDEHHLNQFLSDMKDVHGSRNVSPNGRNCFLINPSLSPQPDRASETINSLGFVLNQNGQVRFCLTFDNPEKVVIIFVQTNLTKRSLLVLESTCLAMILQFFRKGEKMTSSMFLDRCLELFRLFHSIDVQLKDGQDGQEHYIVHLQPTKQTIACTSKALGDHARSLPDPNTRSRPPFTSHRGIPVLKLLAKSGQASVFLGHYQGQKVAIKIFEAKDDWKEWRTEVSLLIPLDHPNIVKILSFYEDPLPTIVMQFIHGTTLFHHLQANGRFNLVNGLPVAIGIANGLQALHQKRIAHRDLKSLNIMLRDGSTPVIIDLGLGRQIPTEHIGGSLITDAPKGTRLWMSPEMQTRAEWGLPTDIYAYGLILWEIFSGVPPVLGHLTPDYLSRAGLGFHPDIVTLIQNCSNNESRLRPEIDIVLDQLRRIVPPAEL